MPGHLRLRGVRADSGFCLPELLALWEQLKLPYVVVAQLSQPIQRLMRHRVYEANRRAGKCLLDVPGYHFQA